MPRYDFVCKMCGHTEERDVKLEHLAIVDEGIVCTECNNRFMFRVRVPTSVGIEFKGKDFYCNEYPKKGSG